MLLMWKYNILIQNGFFNGAVQLINRHSVNAASDIWEYFENLFTHSKDISSSDVTLQAVIMSFHSMWVIINFRQTENLITVINDFHIQLTLYLKRRQMIDLWMWFNTSWQQTLFYCSYTAFPQSSWCVLLLFSVSASSQQCSSCSPAGRLRNSRPPSNAPQPGDPVRVAGTIRGRCAALQTGERITSI